MILKWLLVILSTVLDANRHVLCKTGYTLQRGKLNYTQLKHQLATVVRSVPLSHANCVSSVLTAIEIINKHSRLGQSRAECGAEHYGM